MRTFHVGSGALSEPSFDRPASGPAPFADECEWLFDDPDVDAAADG